MPNLPLFRGKVAFSVQDSRDFPGWTRVEIWIFQDSPQESALVAVSEMPDADEAILKAWASMPHTSRRITEALGISRSMEDITS